MSPTPSATGAYESLRHGAGLLVLADAGRCVVRGRDAARFLHNMLTNDILALQPGQGCQAVKVSVQGKMEAALRVLRLQEELWCDLEQQALPGILATLRRRVVLEDAELHDASDAWGLLSLQGPRAGAVLQQLGFDAGGLDALHRHAPATLAGVAGRVVRSDRTGEGGFDLCVPATAVDAVRSAAGDAGAQPVDPATFAVRRIEAGIPWHAHEITPEHFPQEAGLDAGWISYTKGCYLGQETISRIHHLGHVNRLLRGLSCDGPRVPEPGEAVQVGGKDVGAVTSAVYSWGLQRPIALAYLRREHAAPGTDARIGETPARVTELPFL